MESNKATEIFQKHYQEWINNPSRMSSGYNYEKTYAEMMQKVEHEIFQESIGKITNNKNVKKNFKPVLEK